MTPHGPRDPLIKLEFRLMNFTGLVYRKLIFQHNHSSSDILLIFRAGNTFKAEKSELVSPPSTTNTKTGNDTLHFILSEETG
jgi:hypothetical protein